MKLTTTQIADFQQSLVADLESQVWDFIKTYSAEQTDEDAFIDEAEAIRNQLLEAQERLTISFAS
jgi:hypothetical protein